MGPHSRIDTIEFNVVRDPTSARGAWPHGNGGVHSECWGNHRGGGQAGGRLTPAVNVTIGGYRPPRSFGGVVAFGDKRVFLVASFGVRTADAYHVRI